MSWEAVVEAVASGTGASIGVAALARKWFRSAVQDVVDERIDKLEKRLLEQIRQNQPQQKRRW